MTVHFPIPAEIAALNDKEVEVLRLLAAGHTVKSIAATLGKSEASINERLRDARRKTGVGSSRELARLLDAQKIWDKNIDLVGPRSLTKAQDQPRKGHPWSKGTIAMLLTLPAAAVGLMLAANNPAQPSAPAPIALTAAPKSPPLVGRWSLDVARIPVEERPRQVTMSFRVSDDQKWTAVVEIVDPDGRTRRAESTAALDGVPVPISGNMDFIDTVALRQPAPNTLVMTLGKNGTPVSTRVYAVAKDQKTMTETIVWAGQEMPKLETTFFTRVG
ncbi:MAG: helix-turn-helix transcriptional regulator [Novosphingobium sp.]|jgi:DNA-binding CsgD family transcriptional regulator|uniref:helix-turn-helix domain-containing protein n=1 Tax=Novosphingobium sp. TaxID=1874826 RepID=UPI00391CC9A4|nr:helix-turn-helix transcriptional regulator [Novosphingobium sp.]